MLSITYRSLSHVSKSQSLKSFCNLRFMSSVPSAPKNGSIKTDEHDKRKFHNSSLQKQDTIDPSTLSANVDSMTKAETSPMAKRFTTTVEVTVSKIFPAGFCWQTASIFAGNQGFAPDSLNFALTTGLGDALGVFAGHCIYYAGKKSIIGEKSKINMTKEVQGGILLGTAAFCSGTVWQPIVNALQGANLPFDQVFLGTWLGCGAAFYVGLRVGRTILSGPLKYISGPTYENSKDDMSLSAAIGGATGFFVGTDAAYLPQQNFLINIVGIQPGVPDLTGCAIAGTSTSLGFMTSQTALNVVYPTGKLWND